MKLLVTILLTLLFTVAAKAATTSNCKMILQSDITTSTSSASFTGGGADATRKCMILENKDAAIKVYVKFGSAHSGTEGIVLQPNARWEAQNGVSPQAIFLKAASGAPVVGVILGD